ncbi:hypothetical protein Tco_1362424 [Tanacetum coccineum]
MKHDDVVLTRVKISTLEVLIEDIQDYIIGWILILCYLEYVDRMAPKRKSASAAPTMTQTAIRKLVTDSVVTALES